MPNPQTQKMGDWDKLKAYGRMYLDSFGFARSMPFICELNELNQKVFPETRFILKLFNDGDEPRLFERPKYGTPICYACMKLIKDPDSIYVPHFDDPIFYSRKREYHFGCFERRERKERQTLFWDFKGIDFLTVIHWVRRKVSIQSLCDHFSKEQDPRIFEFLLAIQGLDVEAYLCREEVSKECMKVVVDLGVRSFSPYYRGRIRWKAQEVLREDSDSLKGLLGFPDDIYRVLEPFIYNIWPSHPKISYDEPLGKRPLRPRLTIKGLN